MGKLKTWFVFDMKIIQTKTWYNPHLVPQKSQIKPTSEQTKPSQIKPTSEQTKPSQVKPTSEQTKSLLCSKNKLEILRNGQKQIWV